MLTQVVRAYSSLLSSSAHFPLFSLSVPPLVSQICCCTHSVYTFVLHIYLLCCEGIAFFGLHWELSFLTRLGTLFDPTEISSMNFLKEKHFGYK